MIADISRAVDSVRCVIKPSEAQALLLDWLGIELPKGLAIPRGVAGAAVQCRPMIATCCFPTLRSLELRNLG